MAFREAPAEINIDDYNNEVKQLGMGDASSPGLNEVRMFFEEGRYKLKCWNGTGWDLVGLYLDQNGRLGIGTETPGYDIEVQTTGTGAQIVSNRTDGATMEMSSTSGRGVIGTRDQYPVDIRVDATPKITIDTQGNVGIGTTTPAAKLDVNGSVLISGNSAWHAGNDGAGSGLDADKLKGTEIESGSAAGSMSGQYNAFTQAFTSTPVVVVTPTSIGTGAPYLSSITTTGFTLVTPAQNGFCQYIAIGPR